MPNNYNRISRINEEIRHGVDRILREDVHDPRISGTWSITDVDTTRDLRYAKIRISVLEDDKRRPMMEALKRASGFIRYELGRQLILRSLPELIFEEDENIAYGVHIAKVISEMAPSDQTRADE